MHMHVGNPNRPRSSGRVGSPHISASANITETPVLFDVGFYLTVYRKHNQNAGWLPDVTNQPEVEGGPLWRVFGSTAGPSNAGQNRQQN
jgi:hypothetical protein